MIKIAFLSNEEAISTSEWSGTVQSMYYRLLKDYDVININLSKSKLLKVSRLIKKIFSKITSQELVFFLWEGKLKAKIYDSYLKRYDVEYIFAPVSSSYLRYLKDKRKIVYISDATFNDLVNYYYKNLSKRNIDKGNYLEIGAAHRADIIIESSKWSIKSLENFYAISKSKIYTVPFGSNMVDNYDEKNYYNNDVFKILFVGVDYERKGADILVNAAKELNKRKNYNIEFHFVGVSNIESIELPNIYFHGKKMKNNSVELQELVDLYKMSHIFVLPTKADCTPIVFAEACEYGLPIISTDTGGVSTFVKHDINGYLLPERFNLKDLTYYIELLYLNPDIANLMSLNSRNLYETSFNWKTWGEEIKNICD